MLTGQQKHDILALRAKGFTFTEIARETGLSANTVKSFYRRISQQFDSASKESESKESKKKEQGNLCEQCGKDVRKLPRTKPKRFCCDKCREQWWNARRRMIRTDGMALTPCACCGRVFASFPSAHRKYCSHACYARARFGKEGAYDGRAIHA